MCRLFGFRSIIKTNAHNSLVGAENALEVQSENHPDGWGLAYYLSGAPHVIKSEKTAMHDNLYKKVSGIVSSETVIAHIRNATVGKKNIVNTHPFQYGNWTFAHNGNIKDFDLYKDKILEQIPGQLSRFILGDTDSEVIFFFILGYLSKLINLSRSDCPVKIVKKAVYKAIEELTKIIGDYSHQDDSCNQSTYLTFIITNGATMLAHHGGKALLYSTYKSQCKDRDTCPDYSEECEAPSKNNNINHLIFSSEPLLGDNIWFEMVPGQTIGTDWNMKLIISNH